MRFFFFISKHTEVCVCVCVCVCARACVCVCVRACMHACVAHHSDRNTRGGLLFIDARAQRIARLARRKKGLSPRHSAFFLCIFFFKDRSTCQAKTGLGQHTSAYVSIRQHTSAYVGIRQHTSAYVSIRQLSPRHGAFFLRIFFLGSLDL